MSTLPPGLTFLEPKAIEHKVGDQKLKFYPMSIGTAFKLKSVGKSLSLLLSVLFTSDKNDAGTKIRLFGNDAGGQDSEQIGEPIMPELAALRLKQKADSINSFFDTLTSDETQGIFALIVMDSLRDQFPKEGRPSAAAFMEGVYLPMLPDLLMGVAKANQGVFGPLADEFGAAMGKARTAMREKLAVAGTPNSVPASSEAETSSNSNEQQHPKSNSEQPNPIGSISAMNSSTPSS